MSISPAMTTNVSPNAISPMNTYGVSRSSRLIRVKKNGESVALQIPTPTIATTSSVSQRTTDAAAARRFTGAPARRRGLPRASGQHLGAATAERVLQPPRHERVDRDRDHDRGAVEEHLPELRQPQQRESVLDRRHEHRAEHDAEDRAGAAEDVDAADHDGGDHVELEVGRGHRVDVREARRPT